QTGVCINANPVICVAKDECHMAGECDVNTGVCSDPAKPDGAPCDDGNACTQADTCQMGVCTSGKPVGCMAQDFCHLPGQCNLETGACDSPAKPDGDECDDGDACTLHDTCQAGVCIPGAPNDCSPYRCNKASGQCITSCASIDDCSTGFACDPSHQCVK